MSSVAPSEWYLVPFLLSSIECFLYFESVTCLVAVEKITLQMQLKEGWLSVAQFLDPVHPSEESKAAGTGGSSE